MDHPNDAIAQAVAQLVTQLANAITLIFGTLIVGGSALIVSMANAWFARRKEAASGAKIDLIDKKMDKNTELTVETKRKVDDVKSDVRDAKDAAAGAVQEAQVAKSQAVISNQIASKLSRDTAMGVGEVKELLKDTREAINGRTTELVNAARAEGVVEGTKIHEGFTNRIEKLEGSQKKLEGGHELLVQGQAEMHRKIDKAIDAIKGVGDEVKRQSKY